MYEVPPPSGNLKRCSARSFVQTSWAEEWSEFYQGIEFCQEIGNVYPKGSEQGNWAQRERKDVKLKWGVENRNKYT